MPYRNYSGGAFFLAKKYFLVVALPLLLLIFKFFKSKGGIAMKKINLRDYYPFYMANVTVRDGPPISMGGGGIPMRIGSYLSVRICSNNDNITNAALIFGVM